ncbi:uncharacterized protein [Montipora capricornis]|uniref:uncharacterized protein n=1 Tax=Montipora capricornis TaxID=246305 RepID=UPI0035F1CEAF
MSQLSILLPVIVGILVPGALAHSKECEDCNNCCNVNCVSSEMRVEEQTKGTIRVSQLSNGDIIRGIRGTERMPGWCKVEAVYPRAHTDNFTTYDGFTKDHMVIDADTVRPYGKKGEVKKSRLFTLATECDAALNADGQAFTPISTTFCPHELSWGEYLPLIAAIRRVTNRTGYFWYLSDAFHDNQTAKVPRWIDMLLDICTELLRCTREGECQKFEKIMEEFVHEHLNRKYVVMVESAFPNMGGDVDKDETGTITEVVREKGTNNVVLFSAVGCAVAGLLIAVVASVLLYRMRVKRKQKALKEPHPNQPPVMVQDTKA